MLDPKSTNRELRNFAEGVVKISKYNLKNDGELKKSIDYKLQTGRSSFDLDFEMEDYGIFQDYGVQGADPNALPQGAKHYGKNKAPFSPFRFGTGTAPKGQFKLAINGWLVRKGIAPRGKGGQFTSRKTLAFLIRRDIYLSGIKPKKFFSDPFEQQFQKLPNQITEAYALDIENFLDFTLNKAG